MELASLWTLQNLYLKKQSIDEILNKDEDGKALRREKKQILAALDNLTQLEKELKQNRSLLKKQEDLLADLTSKRQTALKKLYSGEVTNPKELKSIQQQIKMLDEELENYENEFLKLSEKIEEDTKLLEEQKQALKSRQKEYKVKTEKYLAHKTEVEKRREQVIKEIRELEQALDPEILDFYNKQKQIFGLKVLSSVQNMTCSACHMIISPIIIKELKRGTQLVRCENCGRILYYK